MSYVKSSISYTRRSKRSRVRKRGALAIALLGVVAIWLIAHAGGEGHSIVEGTLTRAPLTGVHIAPKPPTWSNAQRWQLREQLNSALAPALIAATAWSFAVVNSDGRTIYDDRADRAVAPASTQKLIVAASALDALGAQYRYHTMFAGRQGIGDGGRLDGNLWLIGSGDPSFQSADLRNGIGMLARAGLRQIDGGVVVDATALNGPEINPHWDRADNGQDYAAPTSAISLDGDTIESHQSVDGAEATVWLPMQNVSRYVATQTQGMLRARGIAVAMAPAVGAAPLDTVVLWDHRSAPLQALETHMLFLSDNHYAEQLLRKVGEEVLGEPDDSGGISAEAQFLERRGIPTPGLKLFDGSGLSADNRIAAITLARLLAQSGPSLYLLLPLGGRQGTLEDYDFTTALGRVRAKSGHLSNVSALAGYVTTLHHSRLAFAFTIDGSPGDPDAAIVRAVDRLVEF